MIFCRRTGTVCEVGLWEGVGWASFAERVFGFFVVSIGKIHRWYSAAYLV